MTATATRVLRRSTASSQKGRGERGSASIQMVVLLPALFTIMFLGLQAALYYYASTVAGAAAQDGARAAAAYGGGGISDGMAAARSALDQSHGSLQDYMVTGAADQSGPEIIVTGSTLSVIPGLSFAVTRSANLPWERPS